MPELDSAALAATYKGGATLRGTAAAFSTPDRKVTLHQVRQALAKERVTVRTVTETAQLRAQQKLGGTSAVEEYKAGEGLVGVSGRYGVDTGLMRVWLGMNGVTVRGRADAGKVRAATMTVEQRRAMVARANAAASGRVTTFQQRCARAASRQGRPGSVIRPGHRDLMGFLKKQGRPVMMEQAIGPYNLAVSTGSRVVIEISNKNGAGPLHGQDRLTRVRFILAAGWDVLFLRVISADFDVSTTAKTSILRLAAWRDAHPDAPPRWAVLHRDGHILQEGTEADLPHSEAGRPGQ
jgi:hypothetical protein